MAKAISKSKITGKLDTGNIFLYGILSYYKDFTENSTVYAEENKHIIEMMGKLKSSDRDTICDFKNILANTTDNLGTAIGNNGVSGNSLTNTISATDIYTTDIVKRKISGVGDTYDTYVFSKEDFLEGYDDSNDKVFHSIRLIGQSNTGLTGGSFKYTVTSTEDKIFTDEKTIEIGLDDLEKWSFYTSSTSIYNHEIYFQFIDLFSNTKYFSPVVKLTVNRTAGSNSPATIGDYTEVIAHGISKPITLASVTSSLSPPYNDPEGDLIDAIRIVEISTANKGVITFNGNPVVVNQVITREDLDIGLLVYNAFSYEDVWADVFRFQARDEGSLKWVD